MSDYGKNLKSAIRPPIPVSVLDPINNQLEVVAVKAVTLPEDVSCVTQLIVVYPHSVAQQISSFRLFEMLMA